LTSFEVAVAIFIIEYSMVYQEGSNLKSMV
jgi:hypothetical protein